MAHTKGKDNRNVNEIVDKLKKQGLFDEFRKKCLADVDTKPAYQNLRHRVENAVNRFLNKHTWRPDMNKNLIRESVRKHIRESQMLASGVDLIIEQVVNQKIYTTFKPAVDKVVCEHLNIDPKEWEEKLKIRDKMNRGEHDCIPQRHERGIPSLLEIPFPNLSSENASSVQVTSGLLSPPVGSASGATFTQAGMYNMYQGFMPQYSGMQGFGFPNQFVNQGSIPGMPEFNVMPGTDGEEIQPEIAISEAQEGDEVEKKKEKKKKLKPLTVEDLLNIPLPKEEEKKPTTSDKDGKTDTVEVSEEYTTEEVQETTYAVTEGEFETGEQEVITTEEIQTDVVESDEQPKVYHFAWQNLERDDASDATVSSVHTSDLSDFDDEGTVMSSSVKDEEEVELELSSAGEEVEEEGGKTGEGDPMEPGSDTSPLKHKPKKLISLQYNLSDSEGEETREERKARIAKEREERTLLRQQRRAEIDAKRQKMLEERLAYREARKQTAAARRAGELAGGREREAASAERDGKRKEVERREEVKSVSPKPTTPKKKVPTTPKKQRKTKEELKQEIREQKVLEKRMALRRKRTINPKYLSEDFESVFTEKKELLEDGYVIMESGEGQDDVILQDGGEVVAQEAVEYAQVNLDDIKLPPGEPGAPTTVEAGGEEQYILATTEDGQQVLVDDEGAVVYRVDESGAATQVTPQQSERLTRSRKRELQQSTPSHMDIPLPSDPPPPATPAHSRRSDTPVSRAGSDTSDLADTGRKRRATGKNKNQSEEEKTPNNKQQESQRYSEGDLYKPRLNLRKSGRRRGSSPSPPPTPAQKPTPPLKHKEIPLPSDTPPVQETIPLPLDTPKTVSTEKIPLPKDEEIPLPSDDIPLPSDPPPDNEIPLPSGKPSKETIPLPTGGRSTDRGGDKGKGKSKEKSPPGVAKASQRVSRRRRTSEDTRSTDSGRARMRRSNRLRSSRSTSLSKSVSRSRSRSPSKSRSKSTSSQIRSRSPSTRSHTRSSSRSRSRSRSHSIRTRSRSITSSSRSQSRPRSRSRSVSSSRSRSRSESYSRSRSTSQSKDRSRSKSKSHKHKKARKERSLSPVSGVEEGEGEESGSGRESDVDSDGERRRRPKRSLQEVSFGEAGRRAAKGFEPNFYPPGMIPTRGMQSAYRGSPGYRPYGPAAYGPRGSPRGGYPPRGGRGASGYYSGYPPDERSPPPPPGRERGAYYNYGDAYYEGEGLDPYEAGRVSSPDARYRHKGSEYDDETGSEGDYGAPVKRKRLPHSGSDVDDIPSRKRFRDTGSPAPPPTVRGPPPPSKPLPTKRGDRDYSPPPLPPVRSSRGPPPPLPPSPGAGGEAAEYRRGPPRRAPPPPPPPHRGRALYKPGPPLPSGPPPSRAVETRTMRRVSDEQNAPIAKRLRNT